MYFVFDYKMVYNERILLKYSILLNICWLIFYVEFVSIALKKCVILSRVTRVTLLNAH